MTSRYGRTTFVINSKNFNSFLSQDDLSDTNAALSAAEAELASLSSSSSSIRFGLGSLCAKVSEITDIKKPVHSSTNRRWFLEDLKKVKSPGIHCLTFKTKLLKGNFLRWGLMLTF